MFASHTARSPKPSPPHRAPAAAHLLAECLLVAAAALLVGGLGAISSARADTPAADNAVIRTLASAHERVAAYASAAAGMDGNAEGTTSGTATDASLARAAAALRDAAETVAGRATKSAAGPKANAASPTSGPAGASTGATGQAGAQAEAADPADPGAQPAGLVAAAVRTAVVPYNRNAAAPVDASLYFDENTLTYQVDPGMSGTTLDTRAITEVAEQALSRDFARYRVETDGALLAEQAVRADDPALLAARDTANTFLACNLTLTVNGVAVGTLDAQTVRWWIVFGDDGSVWIDDASLTAWVDGIEYIIDSVWATRSYVRPDGKWVSVTGGTYGWISHGAETDQLVRDAIWSGTVGSREVPMKQTAAVFNPGGQDWGSRYVDVDLSEQYVRFYDWGGWLIWESRCISGKPDGHQTPTGVYYVTRKDTNQVLTGPWDPATQTYEYESFVQWWMPFIDNMVGLHDASWQPYFGSDTYLYNGSHGCVNLPVGSAYDLFNLIAVGDVVVVHY